LLYTLLFTYLYGKYVSRFGYFFCIILFPFCYEPFYFRHLFCIVTPCVNKDSSLFQYLLFAL
ncbi:hypothetical protein KSS87_002681, partial [Heliosperma pusillum]